MPDRAPGVASATATMNNGTLRDDFLAALEAGDAVASVRLAGFLGDSRNLLPSTVCAQLGLPPGSAYAAAARMVLAGADAK